MSQASAEAPDASRLARFVTEDNMAGRLYGAILVTSVIVGLGKTESEPGLMIVAVVVTTLVFALTHAWATVLGGSAEDRRPVNARALAAGFRHEWSIVQAAFPAAAALALAAAGVYSVATGLWVAVIANAALLFVGLRRCAGSQAAPLPRRSWRGWSGAPSGSCSSC